MSLYTLFDKIKNNRALVKFSLLIFFTEFVRGAYLNFIPLYADHYLDYSVDAIGAVVCAFFLAETVAQIGVGWLLDRFNNRLILVVGLIISFSSIILLKFISSPMMLILEGAIFGLGFAPVWIMVLGYVSKFNEQKRALSMGIVYSAWLSGLGLGSVLLSFLVGRGYMFALNILILLWGLCVVFGAIIKEGIRKEDGHIDVKKSLEMTYDELKNKKYLIPGLLLQTLSVSILAPIVPIYLTSSKYVGLSTDNYGIALSVIGLMTIFFMGFFGSLTKKIGINKLFIYGMLVTSISILGMGNTKFLYVIMFFGIMLAISYSAILPAWNGILANNIREEIRGIMWGSFSTMEGLGRAIGALLGGILGKGFNLHVSFNLSAVALLMLALYYLYLNKNKTLN
ncbi:MAG: MFS transporter [Deltaproteobacteria bacterium]